MKNNNRQILKLLAGREYRQNRRRNRILISVIAMAVCMVFCVFSLAYGKIHSDYLLHIRSAGTAASTTLEYPDDAQYQQIKNLSYIKETGWQKTFGEAENFYCTVLDHNAWEFMQKPAYTDIHGNYPTRTTEVMLPKRVLESMKIRKPYVGMEIPLSIWTGNQKTEDKNTQTQTFTLSGWYTEYVDPVVSLPHVYFSEKYMEQAVTSEDDITTTLLIRQDERLTGEVVEEKLYHDVTMRDDSQQFFGGTSMSLQSVTEVAGGYGMAWVMAGVVLLSAWLLIYNVLHISYAKEVRQYGMLVTLGTTQKQLRSIAFRQILRMIFPGCLAGALIGSGFVVLILPRLLSGMYLRGLGDASGMIAFRTELLVLAVLFGGVVTILGYLPAIRNMAVLSPVATTVYMEKVSVHGHRNCKTGQAGVRQMAWRNVFRFKKRAFLTIFSMALGICVSLGAVVLSKGTDMTNKIQARGMDFKIMSNMAATTVDMYPEQKIFFPEKLSRQMEALQGVWQVEKSRGGYARISQDASFLAVRQGEKGDLAMDTEDSGEDPYYDVVVQAVDDEYLQKLEQLAAKKQLDIDVNAVRKGKGALVLHFNLLSQIEKEKSHAYIGDPFLVQDMYGSGKEEIIFSGYLNYKEQGLPKLETTWNGSGIVYLLVSEQTAAKLPVSMQTFVLSMDAAKGYEPKIKQELNRLLEQYNKQFATGDVNSSYVVDNRSITLAAKSDDLAAAKEYITSSRIIMTALCTILLLIGVINYAHVMMTGYATQQKELRVMESLGMTRKQIHAMIRWEGIFYAQIITGITLTAGSGLWYLAGILIKQKLSYFQFSYPYRELILVIVLLSGICVCIPHIIYHHLPARKRRSCVE